VLTINLINAAIQHDLKHSGHRRNVNILSGEMVSKLLGAICDCGITFKIMHQNAPSQGGFEFMFLMGKEKANLPSRMP